LLIDAGRTSEDHWLRHLLTKQEQCPRQNDTCGTFHYIITKFITKSEPIEISGRLLSRITDGIEEYAVVASQNMKSGKFYGIVYSTTSKIASDLGPRYRIVIDPTAADSAHAYLSNDEYNSGDRSDINVAEEVLLLHDAFSFAAPGSPDLARLEAGVGRAA